MDISRSDFDDSDEVEMDDIMDTDVVLDDTDETLVKSADSKLDVRRRLELYLEEARLKRELELY